MASSKISLVLLSLLLSPLGALSRSLPQKRGNQPSNRYHHHHRHHRHHHHRPQNRPSRPPHRHHRHHHQPGGGGGFGGGFEQPISRDGRCGPYYGGVTCFGSGFGNCCSGNSLCGSDEASCNVDTCQLGYGVCEFADPISTGPDVTTTTYTVTYTSGTDIFIATETLFTTDILTTSSQTEVIFTTSSTEVDTFTSTTGTLQTTTGTATETDTTTTSATETDTGTASATETDTTTTSATETDTSTTSATETDTTTTSATETDTTTTSTTATATATSTTTNTETDTTTTSATETDTTTTTATTTDTTTATVTSSTTVCPAAPTDCGNTGVQFALQYHHYDDDTTTVDVGFFHTDAPTYTGSTTYVGFDGGDSQNDETYNFYGSPNQYNPNNLAINHRGYIYAQVPGTYTINIDEYDNRVYLWVGDKAYNTYSDTNYDARETINDDAPSTNTFVLPACSYTPFRVLAMNYNGVYRFRFRITDPNGHQILGSDSTANDEIIQFSCDGTLAPQFQPYGQETDFEVS